MKYLGPFTTDLQTTLNSNPVKVNTFCGSLPYWLSCEGDRHDLCGQALIELIKNDGGIVMISAFNVTQGMPGLMSLLTAHYNPLKVLSIPRAKLDVSLAGDNRNIEFHQCTVMHQL